MSFEDVILPEAGALGTDLTHKVHRFWAEEAAKCGVDLTGFNPEAGAAERLAWAQATGLIPACAYLRFSTSLQDSEEDQIRPIAQYAARNKMYLAPEFCCSDRAQKGSKERRPGLSRLQLVLAMSVVQVLLVFKLSRLFRHAYKSLAFLREKVVEKGLRAVSVTQNIDTADQKVWRLQSAMHGVMDEELIEAIADHVRAGLTGLHLKGWVTGALPVGYRPQEVPGERPTRRKRPRTRPVIDEAIAEHVRKAFERVAGGMRLAEAYRLYKEEGGAADPRSHGRMTMHAFRRMLSRIAYLGYFIYGRKRNVFLSGNDTLVQKDQPESEHHVVHDESLRIVEEETFWAVQDRLAKLKSGPRGPRKTERVRGLCDLVIDVFHCAHCRRRFHTCGAKGDKMICPNDECPARCVLDRRTAVAAVCRVLSLQVLRDTELVLGVVAEAQGASARGDEEAYAELENVTRQVKNATNRIGELLKLVGEGTEQDQAEVAAQLRAARAKRHELQLKTERLSKYLAGSVRTLTADQVRATLSNVATVLDAAAAGVLAPTAVDEAVSLFKTLVDGHIAVHVEQRPGRERSVVRGVFTPRLLRIAAKGAHLPGGDDTIQPVSLWLRPPPRIDAVAALVAWLYEANKLGFRVITRLFNEAGVTLGCGNVYVSYGRHYEMLGRPMPPRRPRGRHKGG